MAKVVMEGGEVRAAELLRNEGSHVRSTPMHKESMKQLDVAADPTDFQGLGS